jgi:xanthine dehydrogenase accessory factor
MSSEESHASADLLAGLQEAIERRERVALATVVAVQGASPAQPGFKLLVRADGSWAGNVGGGALEQRIRTDALAAIQSGLVHLAHYRLTEEGPDALGMLCGGEVSVFIEPYGTQPALLIVGGGHLGRPLAELAQIVGYAVQVVDVRPERADRPAFEAGEITGSTYVVLITEDHVTDEATLRQALGTPAPYIGMIGSLRKVSIVLDHLRADGFPAEDLARVRAPIGLDLGGRQPAEIALAILAEIECVRHGGSGQPRSYPKTEQDPGKRES